MKDVLRFKKGFKNWNTTFDVKINYEYTAELEKVLTTIEIYLPKGPRRLTIPWYVLKPFLRGQVTPYTDGKELDISAKEGVLRIRARGGFFIDIPRDQTSSILLACNRVKEDITPSIQKLKDEH